MFFLKAQFFYFKDKIVFFENKNENSKIFLMSTTNLRLDISPHSATKKKPGTKYRLFCFQTRQELALARG
jgi:hypothetical protein